MAKLTRVMQKQFGLGGSASNYGQFGSLAAGGANFTTDPATIQALAAFVGEGWAAAVVGDEIPALEDMNGLFLLAFYQLCYLFQAGIPEYDATTTYFENSFCQVNGVIYQSLIDTNIGNTPASNPSDWNVVMNSTPGANVASGSSITLGNDGNVFKISGTTNINTIAIKPAGSIVRLIFLSTLTVTQSGNIILPGGSFTTQANYTLTLYSDGSNWFAVAQTPANQFGGVIAHSATDTTTFTAVTDGFVYLGNISGMGAGGVLTLFADNNITPSTARAVFNSPNADTRGSITLPVKAGNNYRITLTGGGTVPIYEFWPL